MNKRKTLKFIKIRCSECVHLNLVSVMRTFRLYEPIKCQKCSSTLAKQE